MAPSTVTIRVVGFGRTKRVILQAWVWLHRVMGHSTFTVDGEHLCCDKCGASLRLFRIAIV